MKTLFCASLLLLASTAGALAYCPPVIDDANSNFVQNNLNRALCLQGDMAADAQVKQQLFTLDMTLQNLQQQQLKSSLTFPPIGSNLMNQGF